MNMMRKNNNRNNNQRRGGGGRRYGGGGNNSGGGNRQNEGQNLQRQKHHATQMREKYNNLAREAQINSDRVDVEYYLQHVDHYNRILTDISAIEAERFAHQREQQIVPGGPNDPNAVAAAPEAAANPENAAVTEANAGAGEGADFSNSNQPRITRQPRDNGAREANSNSADIPLPGSILPPI